MKALSESEVSKTLSVKCKEWQLDGNLIKRNFKFKTFVEAFSFMTAVALKAEKLDHHPDWSNAYNTVNVKLSTHDARGITKLDFELAEAIDSIFTNFQNPA